MLWHFSLITGLWLCICFSIILVFFNVQYIILMDFIAEYMLIT